MSKNTLNTASEITVGSRKLVIHQLDKLPSSYGVEKLPFCLKLLLENLLRHEDGRNVTAESIQAFRNWLDRENSEGPDNAKALAFTPSRVVLQDFTGVPAVVDLAAMRDAIAALGGDPDAINPLVPVDLVIDHSVMVDFSGNTEALEKNISREFARNRERYEFLRWGQQAFRNFRVVPPGTGIVHQVNLEYLATVVTTASIDGKLVAYPDTLVGTDSHTTMVNALGVLGWGVGGIEAEAAMLGQPLSLLLPAVVGVEFRGALPAGVTATDLVLHITRLLRTHGVVGKFVEFFGEGLDHLSLADRATLANMAPEYGATVGIFPIDNETLKYLRLTGRSEDHIDLVEAYAKAQGLWREPGKQQYNHLLQYNEMLCVDLTTIEPCLAGPKRPQDSVPLTRVAQSLQTMLETSAKPAMASNDLIPHAEELLEKQPPAHASENLDHTVVGAAPDKQRPLQHGDIVIAAITSCTNTSNPSVMLAAGLLAKNARTLGLTVKPWVKTSLAPGSQVVPAYLQRAGLAEHLDALGFNVVGFGCTTCIGNSGPLDKNISQAIQQNQLIVAAVLSGNRNFEGRIHADVRANYLASPPLVVAYALAGTVKIDLTRDPLGTDGQGRAVFLKDIWPTPKTINALMAQVVTPDIYRRYYAGVFKGSAQWQEMSIPESTSYSWPASSYIKKPPFFDGITATLTAPTQIENARCLAKLGDSITTDHISPAGSISPESPAGKYLLEQGMEVAAFNSLGSRRGNHEVMMRGTFANVRLQNQLVPDKTGGYTRFLPTGEVLSIYDAAMRYQQADTPLIILAGKEYGTGSSRDWAAKGTKLLGVKAVIAESFERIHRANLVGFGVLPLQFSAGENAATLGLTGEERFTIEAFTIEAFTIETVASGGKRLTVTAETSSAQQPAKKFQVDVRIDTPTEWDYFANDGILHSVLRQLAMQAG